jgi:hypothetical protein
MKQSEEWTIGDMIRWAITAIALFLFTAFLTVNLDKLAEEKDWNTVLTRLVAKMPDISPLIDNAWFQFLFGCFVTIAVFLWGDWWKSSHSIRIKSTASEDKEPQPAIPADIEFFPTIDDLRTRHPLPDTFKPGNEIHAYLLTGEGIFAEHSDYMQCIKRLILPMPERNRERLKSISRTIDFPSQIRTYMKMAVDQHRKARYYKDFMGMSLLFCNPDRQDGWVQIGPILPNTESAERPHFRFSRKSNEKAFFSLFNTFGRIWDESAEQESIDEAPAQVLLRQRTFVDEEKVRLIANLYKHIQLQCIPQYDSFCDKTIGPWKHNLLTMSSTQYSEMAWVGIQEASAQVRAIIQILNDNKIYSDVYAELIGIGDELNNLITSFRAFEEKYKRLPERVSGDNLELVADQGAELSKAVMRYGQWLRGKSDILVNMRNEEMQLGN